MNSLEIIKLIPHDIFVNLDKYFDQIIEVYPEFKEYIEKQKNEVTNCTNCKKTTIINKIIIAIVNIGGFDRNLNVLSFLGKSFIDAIKNRTNKEFDLHLHFFNKRINYYPAMRDSCLDCCKKHIGMAIVYLEEYISDNIKYQLHYDDACAHLAHAEVESMQRFPSLSQQLRSDRLSMIDNYYNTFPDLRKYYLIINNLKTQI